MGLVGAEGHVDCRGSLCIASLHSQPHIARFAPLPASGYKGAAKAVCGPSGRRGATELTR
jgi:hypothetical protein